MTKATSRWSYRCGQKGVNRICAYEKDGVILLEFYERSPDGRSVRKRVSLKHCDREDAKLKADELAAALRRGEPPKASSLTLHALFYNWYLKEVTPEKSKGKQRHDATCAEMFCRCFGGNRRPQTLNIRDWKKYIKERRAGTLRPLSLDAGDEKKPIRPVSDLQIRYDLKFLVAVLNFATLARDDQDDPLLAHNPLKGLPYPSDDTPCRPMLMSDSYERMSAVAARVHPRFPAFLALVHETGHRAASVRTLRWSDLDLVNKIIRWRPENDKIGFAHETPLSDHAAAVLAAERARAGAIGDAWVFPSDRDPRRALSRHTAIKWWLRAEGLAAIPHVPHMGFHSARRKFASELKGVNLRDLAHLGGWKTTQTVVMVYQQPEIEMQRAALAGRQQSRVGGIR